MKEILRVLKQYRSLKGLLLASVIFTVCLSLIEMQLNISIADIVDITIAGNASSIAMKIGMIIILAVVILIFHIFNEFFFGKMMYLAEKEVLSQNTRSILRADYECIRGQQSGDILSRFNEDSIEMLSCFKNLLHGSIATMLKMLIFLAILLSICWPLALFVFILPVGYNSVFLLYSKKIQPVNHNEREAMGKQNDFIVDQLMGWMEVHAFNLLGYAEQKHASLQLNHDHFEKKKASFWSKVAMGDHLMSSCFYVMIVILGVFFVNKGWMTWGNILLFLTLAPTFLNFIWDLDPQSYRRAVAAIRRVEWLWILSDERKSGENYTLQGQKLICCQHVDYQYPNADQKSIFDINLSVNRGEIVALIGENGSGKSTLLHCIGGLLQNYEGSIEVGGHEVQQWSLKSLRDNYCYMHQVTEIYHESMLFNVTLGIQREETVEEQKEKVYSILRQTSLDYIDVERGISADTLSDGERQRIGIARCLYKGAPIWLLDEPTSSLDIETETQIIDCIRQIQQQQENTILVITHRSSLMKIADRSFIMRDGKLFETSK